jgi:hypothetical protein
MKTTRQHLKIDLSPAENAEGYRKQPTAEAREGWEEERSHHALAGEIHLLARTSHSPVHGCLERLLLVSMKAKDDRENNGEARVVLNLGEEHRSSFEKFDSRS